MEKLTEQSRAAIEFSLRWHKDGVSHQDNMWTENVSMWRDCFPGELHGQLLGKKEGESVTIGFSGGTALAAHDRRKIVAITPAQFAGNFNGERVALRQGRFYPQGMLRGVANVFSVTALPCRYLGEENGKLVFDLNHPLSDADLEVTAHVRRVEQPRVERGGRCEDWLEALSANGPGMQGRYGDQPTDFFAPDSFSRRDESDDRLFYEKPRFVQHIDSTAVQTLQELHGRFVKPGMRVLDLMGSWTTHLPAEMKPGQLTVLGMNSEELIRNSRADGRILHDLNKNPILPLQEGGFDVVLCSLSMEYLTSPLEVFRQAARVLRKEGLFLVSFSNRWFPPKVTRIWTELHEFERMGLVLELFRQSGCFSELRTFSRRGLPRPDDDPHHDLFFSDPVYLVCGRKKFD